jgi:hypothetical protein
MRKDLGYETASPLERLLIQQVSLCWLKLNLVEEVVPDWIRNTDDVCRRSFPDDDKEL